MAIVIDPTTKRLILDSTNVTAQSIYVAWVDWIVLSDNIKYLPAFSSAGGDDLGGGLFIPAYYFLENGWRVRPMESNHNLDIVGNLFVRGGGDPIVPTLGVYQINTRYTVSVQAQAITTSGSGSSITLAEIEGSTVLAKEATSQSILAASGGGGALSPTQETMLLEMYNLLGLDPTKPLIVTDSTRSAGTISQTIMTSASETIVTRV